MEPLNLEQLISHINLCFTLSEEEKADLNLRILDEMDRNDGTENAGRLSDDLREEIEWVLKTEAEYLKESYLPEQDEALREAEKAHDRELDRVQPELEELVNDYDDFTRELMAEYDEEFAKLDRAFDELAKREAASHEETEIASIREKLKNKPS